MRVDNVPGSGTDKGRTTPTGSTPDPYHDQQSESTWSSGATTPKTLDHDDNILFDAMDIDNAFNRKQSPPQRHRENDGADSAEPEIKGSGSSGSQTHDGVLPKEVRCSILPTHRAVWVIKGSNIRLSALVATVLLKEEELNEKDLELCPNQEHELDRGPTDPISGIFAATHSTVGGVVMGLADYPREISKMMEADRDVAKGLAKDLALDSGKGVSRIISTGLCAPMEFTKNISQGFNNLPDLYGDTEGRHKPAQVTGISSGLAEAGQGLGEGLFYGVTGLFTQPYEGAKEQGVAGFFKGFGKGIGGAICKPVAGAVGLPAYAFKGVYEEVKKQRDTNAQIALGHEEWKNCTQDKRAAILATWFELGFDLM